MAEMFYGHGPEATDIIFAGVVDRMRGPRNLVTLDNSIQSMFDNGSLNPTSMTHQVSWYPLSMTIEGTTGSLQQRSHGLAGLGQCPVNLG
ncbi:hypothetical protein HOY80DRAFT_1053809 [Tuber brumale]|nr:hypothetical protein HOY80DRAFT_1053809 [Tuber brumale]